MLIRFQKAYSNAYMHLHINPVPSNNSIPLLQNNVLIKSINIEKKLIEMKNILHFNNLKINKKRQ
jgi:hypothetical protein